MTHPNTPENFWQRADRTGGESSCWSWGGHLDRHGYGRFRIVNQWHLAHRYALELTIGRPLRWDDTSREEACHTCDNPSCVNPRHLYVGDRLTNMSDAVERGRLVNPLAAANAAKDECPKGHAYDEANTYHYRGARQCKTCRRAANRQYRRATEARRDDAAGGRPSD